VLVIYLAPLPRGFLFGLGTLAHFSHSAVRKILSRMAENGDLVRLKFGKYTLPQGQCHTVTVPGENDPDGRSVTV
jgi:hypothetical protein